MLDDDGGAPHAGRVPPSSGSRGLLTVGHGALAAPDLVGLVRSAFVTEVVDVRRFPASRRNPDVAREALAVTLPGAGVGYRWAPALGGRRHLPAGRRDDSPDTWWEVDAFRAYAAWTRTEEFRAALQEVLALARVRRVAVMCSESVWWRCHRRLIADVAVLAHGVPVHHLMPDGGLRRHEPAEGARRVGDDLVWDGPR